MTAPTPDQIEERLHEAIQTLAALPDREMRWLNSRRVAWPETLREAVDVLTQAFERIRQGKSAFEALPPPRVTPSAEAITRMDQTLPWLTWLDADERRIVTLRAFQMSFTRIGWRFRVSDETARRRHRQAIEKIARKLRAPVPA